jgi:hypothetical protein
MLGFATTSGTVADPLDGPSRKSVRNRSQTYLLGHHFGIYLYLFSGTAFVTSFLSDTPFFFYFVMFFLSVSLDLYANACSSPGIVSESPSNTEGLFFCTSCNLHCPVRAAHCHTCGHCVLRKDHHCPWTGRCIGRDNHCFFLTFLLLEVILMAPVIGDIGWSLWQQRPLLPNIGAFCILPACLFAWGLSLGLAFDHGVLALHNETIWQRLRRDRISYLQDLPDGFNPFDRGCLANFVEFVTMRSEKRVWKLPEPVLSPYEMLRAILPRSPPMGQPPMPIG